VGVLSGQGHQGGGGRGGGRRLRRGRQEPPAELTERARRYQGEQEEIKKQAEAKEHERDARSTEGDELMHRHHGFANAVALFQVSIALGALAALTRSRPVWFGSLGLGAIGLVMFAQYLLRT